MLQLVTRKKVTHSTDSAVGRIYAFGHITNYSLLFMGNRSPSKVWKSYLDETENMAKQRVVVAEKEQTDIAEKIKAVKTNKVTTFKKVNLKVKCTTVILLNLKMYLKVINNS